MRESSPIARATSDTSAPVASQIADRELMLDILWARNAFEAWLVTETKEISTEVGNRE